MIGTGIESVRLAQEMRAIDGRIDVIPGGESLLTAAPSDVTDLMMQVLGVWRQIFVYGVDNPDDVDANYYIP